MLEAPRWLEACALLLLDAPPKALVLRAELLLGTCRLPMLFPPPPPPRFAPKFPGPPPAFGVALFVAGAFRLPELR